MKTRTILTITIAFIIGFLVSFTIAKLTPTGQVIDEPPKSYTYTRAICNSDDECLDVLVECKNGKVSSLKPISEIKEFENINNLETKEFCD